MSITYFYNWGAFVAIIALLCTPVSAVHAYGQSYYQSSYYSEGYYEGYYEGTYYSEGYYEGSYATTFTGSVQVTGDASVVGSLAKGAGSFVIDHPLDPKNKLLYHSFVESDEVKNMYDGIVELDSRGHARITLTDWFLPLNTDFRYLATALGEPMPDLHIEKEIKKRFFGRFGRPAFIISGGVPGGRVSWQVTGVRHDPYIKANPIEVEIEKGPDALVPKGECIFAPLCEQGSAN